MQFIHVYTCEWINVEQASACRLTHLKDSCDMNGPCIFSVCSFVMVQWKHKQSVFYPILTLQCQTSEKASFDLFPTHLWTKDNLWKNDIIITISAISF